MIFGNSKLNCDRQKPTTRYVGGVSLLELLIVLVIISILAVIAYPSYREYAVRAKRSEAKAALLQIATNEERFYLQNEAFTTDMRNLGFSAAGNVLSDSGSYVVNVNTADAGNFTARATYQKAGSEAGKCSWFQIDALGARTSGPAADCWTRSR